MVQPRAAVRGFSTGCHPNRDTVAAVERAGFVIDADSFHASGLMRRFSTLRGEDTFAFPSTSPTDFESSLARKSICRLVDEQPSCIYVVHFGAR